jgi:hypothetical protein
MKKNPVIEAVQDFVRATSPCVMPIEAEGDVKGWHIRLMRRVATPSMTVELWALWHGDVLHSSPTSKSFAQQWRDQELAKKK